MKSFHSHKSHVKRPIISDMEQDLFGMKTNEKCGALPFLVKWIKYGLR